MKLWAIETKKDSNIYESSSWRVNKLEDTLFQNIRDTMQNQTTYEWRTVGITQDEEEAYTELQKFYVMLTLGKESFARGSI